MLAGFGQAGVPIVGGDGPEYNLYALNLVQHGAFSLSTSAPYLPGITRTPGYPAFLALLHLIDLHSVFLVRLVQLALVAVTAWLVYVVASRFIDRRTGAIAAIMCATFSPLLWFATQHMTEVLATFCATLLILTVLIARARRSSWWWALVGLVLAASSYVRPEYAGLAVPLTLSAVRAGSGGYRSARRWLPAAMSLLTFLAALAPWTIRNLSEAHELVPLDAGSGVSLYASAEQYAGRFPYEHPTAQDWTRFYSQVYTARFFQRYKRNDVRAQVALNSNLTHQALSLLRQLPVSAILKSLPRRIVYMWGPSDSTPPHHRLSSLMHKLGIIYWGILALLILVGMILRRRTLLADWPLWIFAAYMTVVHVVYHVEARYTLPARPLLLAYAALAVVAVFDRVTGGRARGGGRVRRQAPAVWKMR